MKKILLTVLGVFFFTSACFAYNYYSLVEVLIKNDAGSAFIMSTITKTSSKKACDRILSPINLLKNEYYVRTECVTGKKWDQLYAGIFANKPASAIYISYKDTNGYETRINSKIETGFNSATPGWAENPPVEETIAWANAMIQSLQKGGIKNARIIYPAKK